MTKTNEHFDTLTVAITPPFTSVTLNRPDVKNAMNAQMVRDLIAAFEALRDRRDVRAVVLSGAEGTFCAGGDIRELAAAFQSGHPEALGDASALDHLLQLVNTAPQVVIAKIQGAAMGGGFGLVCVSDIAIASSDAKLGLPEVRLGLVPALISPYVIQRLGLTRARELMLTGRRFGAQEAESYGLVHEFCDVNDLDARINDLLEQIRQCSPNALAACKRLLFAVMDKPLEETLQFRTDLLAELRRSDDGMEGMMAFVQKRKPRWAE
ncbi:MAG: enoyl-CoA hydratase/isomerase family protein [Chloroflexi bacterium]|nr:enoyl-CoA hydratase/isomerase family protein [Chloroflexota bacterium]